MRFYESNASHSLKKCCWKTIFPHRKFYFAFILFYFILFYFIFILFYFTCEYIISFAFALFRLHMLYLFHFPYTFLKFHNIVWFYVELQRELIWFVVNKPITDIAGTFYISSTLLCCNRRQSHQRIKKFYSSSRIIDLKKEQYRPQTRTPRNIRYSFIVRELLFPN